MTDRATLLNSVIDFAAREGDAVLVAQQDTFLLMAEARIAREIRVAEQVVRNPAFTVTDGVAELPNQFLGFRSVGSADADGVSSRSRYDYLAPDVFFETSTESEALTGIVQSNFYTISDGNIYVLPKADTTTLDITYWQRFAALVNNSDTNWLLTNHFDVYLSAVLRELNGFLMDDQQELFWDSKFKNKVEDLHRSERRKLRSGPHIRRPAFAP